MKWLSLHLGLELTGQNNITKILVFGYSKLVIQKMRTVISVVPPIVEESKSKYDAIFQIFKPLIIISSEELMLLRISWPTKESKINWIWLL